MQRRVWGWRAVLSVTLGTVSGLAPSPSHGQAELSEPAQPEVHGFVSQGFIKTTKNNYLNESERGSFDFTEAAINFTQPLTEELRMGLQLFAQDLGPAGNFDAQFDWYYLDYQFRDWLGIRAGRTKVPFGLYGESSDIDAARIPILLPQSVYETEHRGYLFAQTGGELYGHHRFGGVGALEYRAYGGTFHAEPPPPRNGITTQNLRMPYVWGGRLMWETPLAGLRAGGSFQSLRFDYELQFAPELAQVFQLIELLPPDYIDPLSVEFRVKRWVASLEYQTGDLLLASEYSRWTGEFESIAPKLLRPRTLNERYYVMAAYRVNSWFTPAAYYSVYYPNVHQRRGFHSYQRDLALSFRYDLNQHWLMKIEGHWMHGTADLDPSLNDGKEPDQLTKDWAALLVKTTAYF